MSKINHMLLAVMLLSTTMAHAAVLTWTFQNVTFDDGGTLSGFFRIQSVSIVSPPGPVLSLSIEDFDVKTTAGTSMTTPFEYTPANAKGFATGNQADPLRIFFETPDFYCCSTTTGETLVTGRSFSFEPGGVLTDAGGNFVVDFHPEECCEATPLGTRLRVAVTGTIFSPGVPEPSEITLLGVGLGLLLFFMQATSRDRGVRA